MLHDPLAAYEQGNKATDSNRSLESAALYKTARLLESCLKRWNDPDRESHLKEALSLNQKLWTFFQTELARPDHALPVGLRVDLLRLSAFVDRRTFDLLASPSPEKLTALIDINRHVASGLAGTPA
jgi:flagellar protein FlaF